MGRMPRGRSARSLQATKTYDPVFGTTTSATHIAAIEIDPGNLRRSASILSPWRRIAASIINPLIVDGQVHGGVAQGIGAALYEEVVYDDAGQIDTASLVDYLVPTAAEIPAMQVVHLERVVADHAGRLSRHGRGRHHRRAGGDRQCGRRRAGAARHRGQRICR